MPKTVVQVTQNPTNKLTAGTAGAAAVAILGLILKNLAPGWYDPDALLTIAPIVVLAFGYVIKDRDNTP